MEHGWPIGFNCVTELSTQLKNHKGSLTFPEYVDIYTNEKINLGDTLGPYSTNPLSSNPITSPLNTVPEKYLEDRRVILDLSFHNGKYVNDGIQKSIYIGTEYTLSYPTIDDFIDIFVDKGEGCLMYKKSYVVHTDRYQLILGISIC